MYAILAQSSLPPTQTRHVLWYSRSIYLDACACNCLYMMMTAGMVYALYTVSVWCATCLHNGVVQCTVSEACHHVDMGSIYTGVALWCVYYPDAAQWCAWLLGVIYYTTHITMHRSAMAHTHMLGCRLRHCQHEAARLPDLLSHQSQALAARSTYTSVSYIGCGSGVTNRDTPC